jgi:membrane-bound lytic murein transglycosylase D
MKALENKELQVIVKVILAVIFLSSCQAIDEVSETLNPPSSIDINPVSAALMIDQDPWELLTDFDSPYSCFYTEVSPNQSEPNWVAPETVWQRIRLGYGMNWFIDQPRIEAEFNWYKNNPRYMARVSERSQRYIFYVTDQLAKQNMPLELALLPIVESAYDPFAYSHGRASGMWQFIPGTGRMFKLKQDWWYDGRRDIVSSTAAAISYLKSLNKYYDGDWLLALAAYNSGQGNVNKAIRKNKKLGKPTDFWSLDLPNETRSYVPKLLALAKIVEQPLRYNIHLFPVPNQDYFAIVDTISQIDLAQAASMANIDIDELYRLNPGYNRWATSPDGPHRLLLPFESKSLFESNIANLPATDRLNWQRYKIKQGDSLILLAKRFKTDVDTIRKINDLGGNMIRTGQTLMIPTASQHGKHYSLSADQRLEAIYKRRTGGKNSNQHFHKVSSGESLWTIARHYQVHVSELAHWNGIAPADLIKPGQKLSVWLPKSKSQSVSTKREAVVRTIGYKVRNGDSLARIASRFNVGVNDLIKWNKVNPKKYLQPGQQLKLHIDITNAIN